jgi:anti-sigma factor RsiW
VNCQEIRQLLHGYVDGELDLVNSLEIEQHLQECAGCAQAHEGLLAVRTAIKGGNLRFDPPADLQSRIRSALREVEGDRPLARPLPWLKLALVASLLLVVFAGWTTVRSLVPRPVGPGLTEELLASHVRSQMLPNHRIDVESSNQHTVKPWFEGKLDFSPPVPDLSGHEFVLVGGRLDYVDHRPVAALVYQRRSHLINLFIWPAGQETSAALTKLTRQGFHLFSWTAAGMTYWAVSDLNEAELQDFAQLISQDSSPATK